MIHYKNLLLIGTNHVSRESVNQIEKNFNDSFSVVAIELDNKRLYGLLHPETQNTKISFSIIKKVGIGGFLFALLGRYVQQKIGSKLNTKPGSDMLKAYEVAKKNNVEIRLIDDDLEKVLVKISKKIPFREKLKFIKDIFYSLFFPKRYAKKYSLDKIDLSKVPSQEVINMMISYMKKDYPVLHKILVGDRNNLMARRLYYLMNERINKNEKVFAVVGAGHEEEIISIIRKLYEKNTEII